MARAIPGARTPAIDGLFPKHWTASDQERFASLADVSPRSCHGDIDCLRLRAFDLLRLTPPRGRTTERNRLRWLMLLLGYLDDTFGQPSNREHEISPAALTMAFPRLWGSVRLSSENTIRSALIVIARAANPDLWPAALAKAPRHLATRPYTPTAKQSLYRQAEALHEPLRTEVLLLLDLTFEAAATAFEVGRVTAGDVSGTSGRARVCLANQHGVLREIVVTGHAATRLVVRSRAVERSAWLVRPTLTARTRVVWATAELVRKHDPSFEFDANAARHRRICDSLDEIGFRGVCESLGVNQNSHLAHDLLPFMKGR
jgi:hypothetical protein